MPSIQDEKHECVVCKATFSSKAYLDTHLRVKHKRELHITKHHETSIVNIAVKHSFMKTSYKHMFSKSIWPCQIGGSAVFVVKYLKLEMN